MPTLDYGTEGQSAEGQGAEGQGLIEISRREHEQRLAMLVEWLNAHGHGAAVLFQRVNIVYLTGYHFQQTERPVALVVGADGQVGLLVPALESEHATHAPLIGQIAAYPEYPGLRHPMHFLTDLLQNLGTKSPTLAADGPGYPPVWGYRGPNLTELIDADIVIGPLQDFLYHRRSIKSDEVISLIRLSAYWGNHAHQLLQDAIVPGANEVEIGQAVSRAATLDLFQAVGNRYRNHDWGVTPIHAGFKAGPDTATPHPMGGSRPMQNGDLIITWATAKMAGYHAELERTLILGLPTAEQQEFFEHMCRAQAIGIETMQPGVRCADVDEAVYAYWQQHNLLPYVRHHTGHGLDVEIHAPPFLDRGDATRLEPGMLFSVEPGLYVPGVGGFRHSDTILITETGHEVLTWYPRTLDRLTIVTEAESPNA